MRSLRRRGGLAPAPRGGFVAGRIAEVVVGRVCLGIVVLISAMPMILVSCLPRPLNGLAVVADAIDHKLCVFIIILVGFPMRGSIGVRISPLRFIARRRRPRTLFATHIGSSRVVSAGIIPGRERAARGVSVGVARAGMSCVVS